MLELVASSLRFCGSLGMFLCVCLSRVDDLNVNWHVTRLGYTVVEGLLFYMSRLFAVASQASDRVFSARRLLQIDGKSSRASHSLSIATYQC